MSNKRLFEEIDTKTGDVISIFNSNHPDDTNRVFLEIREFNNKALTAFTLSELTEFIFILQVFQAELEKLNE